MWTIKKYKAPHTCVITGNTSKLSNDYYIMVLKMKLSLSYRHSTGSPKLDSDMIANIILPEVKASPRVPVSVIIANIRSQFNYTPSYRKAWIAKQKAMEKMHNGWDASYNDLWQ